jgi:tetratricopeptide (TPR) repeat protein
VVHWAHQVAPWYPDGQLYVNLRGFDPDGRVKDPADAVRDFLQALQVPPHQIPDGLDARAALYRSLLTSHRVLIVIDNARDSAQVRPLLPAAPGCLAILTSRNQLTTLAADGTHCINLDVFTHEEAREFLVGRLSDSRVAAEPEAAEDIIVQCARLPLALAIAAGRAGNQAAFPLRALAADLRESHGLPPTPANAEPAVDLRAVFSWSYDALSSAAKRLFRLLGLCAGPDISAAAAASLFGIPAARLQRLLDELDRASLIAERPPGRYSFHDLLRGYAAEQAAHTDPANRRNAAVRRALDHYLHSAYAAARLLNPHRDPITLPPPQRGVAPEQPADHGEALEWLTREYAVLLASVNQAASVGLDTHTWQLSWTLVDFLYRQGHWHDLAATQRMAITAAREQGESHAEADAHRYLARAYAQLGRFEDARAELQHALHLFGRADDQTGQADSHLGLAWAWDRQGRHDEALRHSRHALDLYRATGQRQGQADALNAVGWYAALLGNHEQALTYCQQALTLHQELNDRQGEAAAWDSLGYAHHRLRQPAQAITCYHHALDVYRNLADLYSEASTLTRLGDTHHATGAPDAAREVWHDALIILNDLGHPDAEQVQARLANPMPGAYDEPG